MIVEPTEPKYEVCCFNHKGERISIFGNASPDKRIEWKGDYTIFVPEKYYDQLRGLTQNIDPRLLSSEKKIGKNNGILSYKISGNEYTLLASLGEKTTKKTKKVTPPSNVILKDNRIRMSEGIKDLWWRLGSKRKTAKLVPKNYRLPTLRRI